MLLFPFFFFPYFFCEKRGLVGERQGKGHILISKKVNYIFKGVSDDERDVAISELASR